MDFSSIGSLAIKPRWSIVIFNILGCVIVCFLCFGDTKTTNQSKGPGNNVKLCNWYFEIEGSGDLGSYMIHFFFIVR